MKIVLDTNVLIAAFISHGTCHEVFEHLVQHHTLISSEFILTEFLDKMEEKFHFNASDVHEARILLLERMTLVTPHQFAESISRDPDDDAVLGTATAGRCDCLLTGDKDLLVLNSFQNIPILRPDAFWEFESTFPE